MDLLASSQDPASCMPSNFETSKNVKIVNIEDMSMTKKSSYQMLFCSYQDASSSGPNMWLVKDAINHKSIFSRDTIFFVSGQDPSATLPIHVASDY